MTLAIVQALSAKPIDVEAMNPVKRLEVEIVRDPELEKENAEESWGDLRAAVQEYVNHGSRRR